MDVEDSNLQQLSTHPYSLWSCSLGEGHLTYSVDSGMQMRAMGLSEVPL